MFDSDTCRREDHGRALLVAVAVTGHVVDDRGLGCEHLGAAVTMNRRVSASEVFSTFAAYLEAEWFELGLDSGGTRRPS